MAEDQVFTGRNNSAILPRGEHDVQEVARMIRAHYERQPPRLDVALAARIPRVAALRQGTSRERRATRRVAAVGSRDRPRRSDDPDEADEPLALLAGRAT